MLRRLLLLRVRVLVGVPAVSSVGVVVRVPAGVSLGVPVGDLEVLVGDFVGSSVGVFGDESANGRLCGGDGGRLSGSVRYAHVWVCWSVSVCVLVDSTHFRRLRCMA